MKGLVRGQSTPLLNQYAPIIWYTADGRWGVMYSCGHLWAFVSFDL